MSINSDPLDARRSLKVSTGNVSYYSLSALEDAGLIDIAKTPFTIRVLIENVLRNADIGPATDDHVRLAASWRPDHKPATEIPLMPGRVVMQDYTGGPVIVDLAAMRDVVAEAGMNPSIIDPVIQSDMVIDHSVQVDYFATAGALAGNMEREFERNEERFKLLKWAQGADWKNLRVVPPGTGIVHQVNLEYLADTILTTESEHGTIAFPDSCLGSDSHTTMINGLGVLGWGVGGIEAEAAMLGQPYFMLMPEVVGVRLTGSLPEGSTTTDLVLSITEALRKVGVVDKLVEYFGPGLEHLPVVDRATIGNMAPDYGATCGFFPIDDQTLDYLRDTGRAESKVELVEKYAKANHMFVSSNDAPEYSTLVEFDLGAVVPSLAGPKRPQDRVSLPDVSSSFQMSLPDDRKEQAAGQIEIDVEEQSVGIGDGAVVIASITSCTNTSNPYVMVGAGLLARNAAAKGLSRKPWVKTSMAPGSKVVTQYLEKAGLVSDLDSLGFETVGYGCTTCIGNSGPLPQPVADAINDHEIVAAAVLSGNRNFEGRIHPQVKANYLASPMLVVAYALAGTVEHNLTSEPLGTDNDGDDVYLKDIWPTQNEISETVSNSVSTDMYSEQYSKVFTGPPEWRELEAPTGQLFQWDAGSTYIQRPPYFDEFDIDPQPRTGVQGARVLVNLGDSVTTDHINPAGGIPESAPSGQFLLGADVPRRDFNSYGSRRGNHNVMVRGTFGNIRLRNLLTPDDEGDWTLHFPSKERMRIFHASEKYIDEGVPLIVIAGKEYGTGSSRDWAAKGPMLLGIRAVIAESYERIHRSNLVGMGIVPLQFEDGSSAQSLGLTGHESYDISGIGNTVVPGDSLTVKATTDDGKITEFEVLVRVDTSIEAEYYRHGGLLPYVLRQMIINA
jgi:aconitate hydratase